MLPAAVVPLAAARALAHALHLSIINAPPPPSTIKLAPPASCSGAGALIRRRHSRGRREAGRVGRRRTMRLRIIIVAMTTAQFHDGISDRPRGDDAVAAAGGNSHAYPSQCRPYVLAARANAAEPCGSPPPSCPSCPAQAPCPNCTTVACQPVRNPQLCRSPCRRPAAPRPPYSPAPAAAPLPVPPPAAPRSRSLAAPAARRPLPTA